MDFLDDNADETQAKTSAKPALFRHMYFEAFCLWLFLLFWEGVTCPAISHSDLHSPTEIITLIGIVYGAFCFGRYHADQSAAFFFGMACIFVFMPRYVFSGPMHRQYRHVPPNVALTIAIWVGVTLGLGFACWLIAKLAAQGLNEENDNSNSQDNEPANEETQIPTP